MSFAETFLLLNDEPNKPLNRHFDDALADFKQWVIDSTNYVANEEYTLFSMGGNSSKTLTHGGTLQVAAVCSVSGYTGKTTIYADGVQIGTVTTTSVGSTAITEVSFPAGAVITTSSGTKVINTLKFRGLLTFTGVIE